MQRTRTDATLTLRLRGQLLIDLQQQREEPGVVEQRMTHWIGLKA